jgi:flagellar assembly factor FliW
MPVTFQSIRFGAVEVPDDAVIEFPFGLIGLGGTRYTLLDRNPGTGFLWLHSVEDPALGLPVVSPYQFFADYSLSLSESEQERTGVRDAAGALLYVTVRATPDPLDITANLRAPLLLTGDPPTHGYQVIHADEATPLRAPLFTLAAEPALAAEHGAGGAPRQDAA